MKTFKVLLEVDEDWFDVDSPLLWKSIKVRDEARQELKEAMVEQIIKKMKVPKITIPQAELRKAVKERMVDKIMNVDSGF